MAPQIRGQIDEYRGQGRFRVVAGRIRETARKGDVIELKIAGRGAGLSELEVHRVINCAGIHENYLLSPRPLIAALIRRGLACANDLGIGFRTDPGGALMDGEGNPSAKLFTLGPPRRGELFEATAVPEIRLQAEALAERLLAMAGPQ
jgi:uncharacterized NAD(P)/FAD-binding protein YdhS